MMTIEQKLSAIKAINEEKEIIEKVRSLISGKTVEVILREEGKETIYLPMTVEIRAKINAMLQDYYNARRVVLIDRAMELMK